MTEKRKFRSFQELIASLKRDAEEQLGLFKAKKLEAKKGLLESQRALQQAHCEDFFGKLETLLPTHETSRATAFQLFSRLCA